MELGISHYKMFKHHHIPQMKKWLPQEKQQHNKVSHQYIQILRLQDQKKTILPLTSNTTTYY